MADQLQLRGGTTTEHATFTGALREVTVDTTKKTLVVHDNATAGGTPLAKENLSNVPAGTITSAMIADGTIATADIADGAITSGKIADGTIVNADISAAAAIDLSKLANGALPSGITVSSANISDLTLATADIADGAVTSAKIADGTIVDADINAAAAIDKTKISGTAITAADTGTVTSTMIADGTIVNADIASNAAIADTKLATISTAGKISNSATTAASANTASAIVARDVNGNFSAGTITASLTGNASTATSLATPRNIQGVAFDGSSNITVVTAGTGISVTGTAVANTGVLSVNGNSGAITNVAVTDTAQSFSKAQRGAVVALTSGATITPDFSAAQNFSLSLGVNATLANPTNLTAGQSGVIIITNTTYTLAFGNYWKFPGGTAPTLTQNGTDALAYYVESATRISARLIADLK